MYAIIKTGGKQYKVTEGDIINVDKLGLEPKEKVEFGEVLAVNDKELKVGTPFVDGAKVEAEVVTELREKKVIIYKKRRRKDSKLKRGFRRSVTRVRITKIAA
jgi:large subunit ribosomal protein L21